MLANGKSKIRASNVTAVSNVLETLFLSQLEIIDRILQFINRRHHLSQDDGEELRAEVMTRLIADNYRVLASYEGKGSLKAYLSTVITHLFQDYRDKKWGRWRPSRRAKQMGQTAILWETLVRRDRHSFTEAAHVMRTNHRIQISDDELEALAAQLPTKPTRQDVDEDALSHVPQASAGPDDQLARKHLEQTQSRLESVLSDRLKDLPDEDRLLVKLRYQDMLSVAQIAKMLRLDQKSLYRRLDKILAGLRRVLEDAGFSAVHIKEVFGDTH